jgi:hypothetical protein
LDGLVEGLEGFLASTLMEQRGSEARQIFRFGFLPDRPRYPLDGEIVLVGIERYQTHQVHRVRMMRIHRERLLAAKLGVERCAGPQMAKAGFTAGLPKLLARGFAGAAWPSRGIIGVFDLNPRKP